MEAQLTNNGPLFKRIALVMAAVRNMPKDGVNTQHNFNYMASDTVLERVGKAMADHGLVIIPTLLDYETVDEKPGNSVRTRTRARFEMHICDADGNAFAARWAGEGTDYGNPDRALNKAMTNATKYFLLKLFVVGAGGDDPDGDSDGAQERKPAPKPAQAARPQQPPAQQPAPQTAAPAPARPKASDAQLTKLHTVGSKAYGDAWEEKRHQLVQTVSKGAITSSADLTPNEASDLIDGIEKKLAAQAETKFNGATPEERGAKPVATKPTASQRMAGRMQVA